MTSGTYRCEHKDGLTRVQFAEVGDKGQISLDALGERYVGTRMIDPHLFEVGRGDVLRRIICSAFV